MATVLTTEEFVNRARKKHGSKYSYPGTVYLGSHLKVTIHCKTCNKDFEQLAGNHISGQGCPACGIEKSGISKTSNTQEFIEKALKKHGDAYSYPDTNYLNVYTKVIIHCNTCDKDFEQIPNTHLTGGGCQVCGYAKIGESKKSNTREFIEKALKLHTNERGYCKFVYDKVDYQGAFVNVIIFCKICIRDFIQLPSNHLAKQGCPYCGGSHKSNTEEFIEKAIALNGNEFDYSKVAYKDNKTKVIIICNTCKNEFLQKPNNHLNGRGCPNCNKSKGEKAIQKLLEMNNISFSPQIIFDKLLGNGGGNLRFDFGVFEQDSLLFLLEYQGQQHFKPWGQTEELIRASNCTQAHDKLKVIYCEEKNIPLEFINYDQDIKEKLYYLLDKYNLEISGIR
jgi:hypothetical protein